MILTVDELKALITTTEPDGVVEMKLQALENMVREHTHNNFQNRSKRIRCNIVDGVVLGIASFYAVGDTVELSNSAFNKGIYTITSIDSESGCMSLSEGLNDESEVLVTKVEYPSDVKMGVVNMLKWDLENRDKVGIQSETISRHSVTYFDMSGDNSAIGYPKALTGFMKPYMKMKGWN